MIVAILVPGRKYTTQSPLLDLADVALAQRGGHAEHISWTIPPGLLHVAPMPFVRSHVEAALYRAAQAVPGIRPIVIAKSLGTYSAPLVAERRLPAIWLTPVLTEEPIVRAIAANPAPSLLIGGTADRLWVPEAAAATGKPVLTIPGADHRMRVPGRLRDYAEVLATAGAAIEEFLDAVDSDATAGTTAGTATGEGFTRTPSGPPDRDR